MRARRALKVLSRFLTVYAAFYAAFGVLAVGIVVYMSLFMRWLGSFDLPYSEIGSGELVAVLFQVMTKPSNAVLAFAWASLVIVGIFVIAVIWRNLAVLTRATADGQFMKSGTARVLRVLAALFIASFALDLVTYGTFAPLEADLITGYLDFKQQHPNVTDEFGEKTVIELLQSDWGEVLQPQMHGSIKLILALLCGLGAAIVRQGERAEGELTLLRSEQSLTI